MKNQCFIHKTKPLILFNETLDLFFFGKRKISFGICRSCGLIFQSESIEQSKMIKSYKEMVTYVDNLTKPSKSKMKTVKRHIGLVKSCFSEFPKKILEVSSMNSYNLKQFKKLGSNKIVSLEPSKRIAKLLKLEGIKVHNTTIEKLKTKDKYDLIILSHVLEHLYDPIKAIKQCFKIQNVNQKILVEIPLFEQVQNYSVGAFQIEHLHYFSEANIIEVITRGGYTIDKVKKILTEIEAPIIAIIASKKSKKKIVISNDFQKQLLNFKIYKKQAMSGWKKINNEFNKINKKKPLYLYGAGWFASQLLFYIKVFKNFKNFKGFIDSSPAKQNRNISKYEILSPDFKKIEKNAQIIISSISTQNSIYAMIKNKILSSQKIIKVFSGY